MLMNSSSKHEAIAEAQRLRDLGYYTQSVKLLKSLLASSGGRDLEVVIVLADGLAYQGYWQEAREIHASFFRGPEEVRSGAGNWIYPAQVMYCLLDTVCAGEQTRSLSTAAAVYNEFLVRGGLDHFGSEITVRPTLWFQRALRC